MVCNKKHIDPKILAEQTLTFAMWVATEGSEEHIKTYNGIIQAFRIEHRRNNLLQNMLLMLAIVCAGLLISMFAITLFPSERCIQPPEVSLASRGF